jgi:hypothetical protein
MNGATPNAFAPDLELADVVPAPEFREFHARFIPAGSDAVWEALHELPMSDVPLTRFLTLLRRMAVWPPARPRAGRGAGADRTLWAALPLPLLHEVAPGYALAAGIGRPWSADAQVRSGDALDIELFSEPGWAKVATDFRLVPTADGTILTTETRVATTDAVSRWRFAPYWALIRPFSGVIRRDVLRAVDRAAREPRRR